MPSKFPEEPDLKIVSLWLRQEGLLTSRFSCLETRRGKTPDFRVSKDGDLVAYCEVKSPNDTWLEDQFSNASNTLVGGARSDPTFNRLARLTNMGVKQFKAVNPDRKLFNILAFVNHDTQCTIRDLTEVLTGHFHASSGQRFPTTLNLSERVIGDSKWLVDAYLWFDARSPTKPKLLFPAKDEDRRDKACKLLNVDPSEIKYTARALR